jgi:uncharacterized protein YndB with AHSA1/START domain
MTIEPIKLAIHVDAGPETAFSTFVTHVGAWWPKNMTVGTSPQADVILEPVVGGRWFERGEDGSEMPWGKVLAWEPPRRILLAWQINAAFQYDPDLITELEITFLPENDGTVVSLEHRYIERMGVEAEKIAGLLRGGWPSILGSYADRVKAG